MGKQSLGEIVQPINFGEPLSSDDDELNILIGDTSSQYWSDDEGSIV